MSQANRSNRRIHRFILCNSFSNRFWNLRSISNQHIQSGHCIGSIFEKEAGKIRFLLCYFISGIGGNLLSLYWNTMHDRQIVSAGASGAIFGLMGGLFWIVFANRGRLGTLSGRGILIMVVLSLYFGFTSTGVDNLAHVGGLICGFLTALLTYRRKNQKILTVSDINDI